MGYNFIELNVLGLNNLVLCSLKQKSREYIVAGLSVRPLVCPNVPNSCPAHNLVI